MDPPEDIPYDVPKATLIKRITVSEQRQLQQLLSAEDLGDQKPTQLLCGMQQLLSEKAGAMDPSLLKELFFQHLPSNIRMILALTTKKSTCTLGELAGMDDNVMEVVLMSTTTVAVPQVTSEVRKVRPKWQV